MYTRAEVERQIKTKKSWTGKQVAKVLLSNFLSAPGLERTSSQMKK